MPRCDLDHSADQISARSVVWSTEFPSSIAYNVPGMVLAAAFAASPPLPSGRPRRAASFRRSLTMTLGPVLVTGATGFIGSHLVPALLSAGYTVHTISRRAGTSTPGVRHHVADVTDGAAVERVVSTHAWHAVLHLAGLVSYTSADASALHAVNVTATETLLEHTIRHSSAVRFVLFSSVAAVGSNASLEDPPLTEDAEWDSGGDRVAYLRTKRKAEEVVRAAARAGRVKAAVLCPSNVYGAGDARKSSRKTQVKAANGQLSLYTNGGVNVVHVRVLVQAFLKVLEVDEGDEMWSGERWLVVGENVLIRDMLATCAEFGGNKEFAPWLCLPTWALWVTCAFGQLMGSRSITLDRFAVATRYHWFDGTRASNLLELEEVSAQEALKDSVDWMRANGMVKPRR